MELKAEDLRIGNKVDLYGSIATIQKADFADVGIAISEGKPIPLTEEWLVKFGFTQQGRVFNIRINKNYILVAVRINVLWSLRLQHILLSDSLELKRTDKVHELQNLCYELGEELTIK